METLQPGPGRRRRGVPVMGVHQPVPVHLLLAHLACRPHPPSSLHCMVHCTARSAQLWALLGPNAWPCLPWLLLYLTGNDRQEKKAISAAFDPLCPLPPKYLISRHLSQSGCFLLTQSQPGWPHKHLSSPSQSLFGWEMGIAM